MKIMKIAMVCILCTTITFVSSSVFAIGIKPSLVIGVLTTLVIRYFLRNLICRIELFFYEIWEKWDRIRHPVEHYKRGVMMEAIAQMSSDIDGDDYE